MKRFILPAIVFAAFLMPFIGHAVACTPGVTASPTLCNGLGDTNTYTDFFAKAFTFIGSLIGILSIIMIVYSGLRMIVSRGEPDQLKTAKAGFSYALIGVGVATLAFVLVIAIQNFIGVDSGSIRAGQINNPLTTDSGRDFILRMLNNFLSIVGVLSLVMIVFNGFRYMTAGGNEKQTESAKGGLLWSVVGFGTVLLAYVIISALKLFLN